VLGARPADVVFLDDRTENVAAAVALGIHGVHFTTPQAARTALATHGVPAPPRG
jgi:2-haloacid dehalogenase